MMTVAQALAQTLVAYGTQNYFCVTGGDHDLWIALHDAGIRIINCRSEASAVYMADGYARITGRPGFVYGQRGPGVANVAAALADSKWAMSPVISLTTAIAFKSRDRFEYQDVDGYEMHSAVTSWNKELHVPHRVTHMVRAAIRVATGPRPGPVHLEVAADLLPQDAGDAPIYREEDLGEVNARRVAPDPTRIEKLLAELGKAQRPLIIAGKGVVISEAWDALERFASAHAIPIVTTLGGKGSISEYHPLSVGVMGRYSRRVATDVLRDADTVLAIGTRLGGLATNGWALDLTKKTLLQIDVDPSVIGHNHRVDLSVMGDARTTLEQALQFHTDQEQGTSTEWSRDVMQRVRVWRGHAAMLARSTPADGIHPAAVLEVLREKMSPPDILCADTGAIAAWAGSLFPVSAGKQVVRSAGSLGWVVPGALGVALGAPDVRTVALTGDGGLLYHIGELETAIRCKIPLVIVVLNNRAFGSEYHLLQHRWGGRDIPEVIDFHDADFAAIAEGFGAWGRRVTDLADLRGALDDAFASGRPALIDILTSKTAEAPGENFRGDSLV